MKFFLKTHLKFADLETVCGIHLQSEEHEKRVCKENMDDVTCGRCKKIMLVYKTDHYNRPRKDKTNDKI